MNEQTAIDTARARQKTQMDTARAAAKTFSRTEQTQLDTERADSRTFQTASQRPQSTMDRREMAAGLTLAGNDTTYGRKDSFYSFNPPPTAPWSPTETEAYAPMQQAEFKGDENLIADPEVIVYRADGTQEYFAEESILTGYDPDTHANWSLEFAVSAGRLVAFSTTAPVGTSDMTAGKERFDNDAGASPVAVQTYYRIPVIRTFTISSVDTKFQFAIGGIYRENIVCNGSKGATVELLKIG